MFSSKHKNTAFFSPLNQFSDVCQMALKAIPGLNKAFRNFLTNTLLMFALLPRKVNFTQLEIYGNYCEKTYRSGFSKHFDWVGFNLELSNRLWRAGGRKAIAIDPSYISKSGKHTQGIGRFWSGCAQQVKHGLEILGIGLIDIDKKDCLSLKAVQTPLSKVPGRLWRLFGQMVPHLYSHPPRQTRPGVPLHCGRRLFLRVGLRQRP